MAPPFPLLNADTAFHFEIMRALSLTRYEGADVGEMLKIAAAIKPGDMESFAQEFNKLALHVQGQADAIDAAKNPVSARDAYFRASTYFRCADFYLHGNPSDPRIETLWDQQLAAFDKALALLPVPGERGLLKADGFDVPIIYYRAGPPGGAPRPTLIACTGFDGSQEELYHVAGRAALERGFNVITFEGPGQPLVLRRQGKGFIHDWERATSPVVDFALRQPEVDPARVALAGWSMGGYLAARAAAFEPRLAAVAAVDGVYDFYDIVPSFFPPDVQHAFEAGDRARVDELMRQALSPAAKPATIIRWCSEQGLFAFRTDSYYDVIAGFQKMNLRGITDQIQCPAWVGEAADDLFFPGQPEKVKNALGDRATYCILGNEDGAGAHCHFGALTLANQNVFDWMNDVFSEK